MTDVSTGSGIPPAAANNNNNNNVRATNSNRPSQQRFLVVVREGDGSVSPREVRSPNAVTADRLYEVSNSLLANNDSEEANLNHSDRHPHDDDEDSGDDIEEDEVDVDAVANEIGVHAVDLLRFIQENPQNSSDPRRISTMMSCHATTLPNAQLSPLAAFTGGSSSRAPTPLGMKPQLVALSFVPGEHSMVGGENEMSPTPIGPGRDGGEADGSNGNGTETQPQSQIVFKYSGSNFSNASHSGRRASLHSAVGEPPQEAKKNITFASNVVTDVIVYEVDQELFVGVEYARHWVGWLFLFSGLILEVVFDVHVGWFVFVDRPQAGYLAVQNWVCVLRAIMSSIYLICCILLGIGVSPSLEFSFSWKGFGITTCMSVCLAGALALEVVTSQLADTPHFFTTSVLHCAWIVLYRVFMKEMVFFAEAIGVSIAIVGFILANVPVDTAISLDTDVVSNVIMLISSILYAAYFLIMSWLRQRSPTAPMVFNIGLVAPVVGFILAMSYGTPLNTSDVGMYGMFQSENIVATCLIAMEGLFVNVCFLGSMMYLDVLSVSACYALKSMFAPMFMHFLVWDKNLSLEPPSDRDQWSAWYFVGVCVVLIGSGIVIYFSSVKRRFVARRVAHSSRKSTPNPYRKRRFGSSEQTASNAGVNVLAVGVPTSPQQPRRESRCSNGGNRIVIGR